MAGIIASSASKTMTSGETAVDDAESGYVTAEQISLSTSPSGSSYSWGLSIPQGSTAARSSLSSTTDESPTFTPDVAGEYVVSVTVDGSTSYVLRITVTQIAQSTALEALRLSPIADASVPAPANGVALYYSSDQGALAQKDSNGDVSTIDTTSV